MKKLDMFFVIGEYFIICRRLQQLLWSSWRFKCKWLEEVGIKWGTRFAKTCVSINYFVRFFTSNFNFPCNLLSNDTDKDVFLWVLRNVLRKPFSHIGQPLLHQPCVRYVISSFWHFLGYPHPQFLLSTVLKDHFFDWKKIGLLENMENS